MDKSMMDKYLKEMREMQKRAGSMPAVSENIEQTANPDTATGGLIVSATSLKGLFPVTRALVTVYKGTPENAEEIDRDYTDESGRTKKFILPTPPFSASQTAGSAQTPYALYNISIKSDGFIDWLETDIPVFPNTVSLQSADLTLSGTAGKNDTPRPFSDFPKFDL
ncbi:MAG: hypothetical protein IJN15_04625 [Clostridia bacterium]|nr:hypothetical protein [Clostridia bacterium]